MNSKNVNRLLVSAIALTVSGAAGAASAGVFDAPTAPTSIIKVGNHGCEGKNGCEGHATEKAGADKEKCYGVVKAGHNDCANAAKTHSCAGHAEADGAAGEWLTLPSGVCDKLVGGSTTPKG